MTGENNRLIASGRTDAGVHAIGQVANFYTSTSIPTQGFLKGLNSMLPKDIAILEAKEVPQEFHAIRSSICKLYAYRFVFSCVRLPLWEDRAWVIPLSLDLSAIEEALKQLVGTHDFTSFCASGSSVKSNVRTIYFCEIKEEKDNIFPPVEGNVYTFSIAANGFLRYMVRNIVGVLYEIGSGKMKPKEMGQIIAARDRASASITAPPQGLYLCRVFYDKSEIPFSI